MGKYTNKPKGRPTKRKTLKLKYKIERKVKQHNKRVKKEAKKMKAKGVHHKKDREGFLPNLFPFKQQMLDEAKRSRPTQEEPEHLQLDASEYGMVNLENKYDYLPKPKENLIKKYVNSLTPLLDKANVVLEILDCRNAKACVDEQFRKYCQEKGVKIISVLSKADTVKAHLPSVQQQAKSFCDTVVKFSTDHRVKADYLEGVIAALKEVGEGTVLVAGKALTGKHTFINHLAKQAGKYHESPYELRLLKITSTISLIDAPFKIQDTTRFPLFHPPNPILEDSLSSQQQALIRQLFVGSSEQQSIFPALQTMMHYQIQKYTSVSDFVAKVGRALKIFGKGGAVDGARVRSKVLTEWFTGKLNLLLFSE